LSITPWSVTGTQLAGGVVPHIRPPPRAATFALDPAGQGYLNGACLAAAGGASGALYALAGLSNGTLPSDVGDEVRRGLAAFRRYMDVPIIHVASMDLRGDDRPTASIVEALAPRYAAALVTAARHGCTRLRVPPLAGGVFAGARRGDIPGVTARALCRGFDLLSPQSQATVVDQLFVDLCIYDRSELAAFAAAVRDAFADGRGPTTRLHRHAFRFRRSDPTPDGQSAPRDLPATLPAGADMRDALAPYRLDDETARRLGLGSSPAGWPRCGIGRQAVDGGRFGDAHAACAASTVTQLLAHMDGDVGLPAGSGAARAPSFAAMSLPGAASDLAHAVRHWTADGPRQTLAISDAWNIAVAATAQGGAAPRLLVLRAQGSNIVWDHASLLATPNAWDGRIVAAIGDGGHFCPVWWGCEGRYTSCVPRGRDLVADLIPQWQCTGESPMAVLVACGATVVGRLTNAQAHLGPGASFMSATHDDLGRWLGLMAPSGGDGDGRLHGARTSDPISGALACNDLQDVGGSGLSGSLAANIRSRISHVQLRLPDAPAPGDGGIVLAFDDRVCWAARFRATTWSGAVLRGLIRLGEGPGVRGSGDGNDGGNNSCYSDPAGPGAPEPA